MPTNHEIAFICSTVEKYFNLRNGSIFLNTRKTEIVQARQIAMYFAKNRTKLSFEQIGSQIGGKDHSTVLHACKIVENLANVDKKFKQDILNIEKLINLEITEKERMEAIIIGLSDALKKSHHWNAILKETFCCD